MVNQKDKVDTQFIFVMDSWLNGRGFQSGLCLLSVTLSYLNYDEEHCRLHEPLIEL